MEIAIESPPEAVEPQLGNDQGAHARTEKFVSFQLGENMYAVHAAAVAEVTHPLPVTPLPDQPPALLGISPLRGEIVAAVDMRALLGEAKTQSQKSKQIVLKPIADVAAPIAFTVDRLGEIAAIDLSGIRRSNTSEFVFGDVETDGRVLRIVSHANLASAIEPNR